MSPSQSIINAVKAGDQAQVNALLDQNPELVNARSETGESAILLAAYYGQKQIAQLLLNRGATLDLFEAAAVGQAARVAELLEADPGRSNAFSSDGFQPLGLASFFGHAEVAALLLARGAEVNTPSRNPMHVRPLHSAVAGRHTAVAEMLLKHGAEVNARQEMGCTPLYAAAQNGQIEMVKLLLAHGADANLAPDNGQTPIDAALAGGHHDVAALLREAQAESAGSDQLPPQEIIDDFVGNAHGNFARVEALLEQYPALLNASASWNETAIEAAAQTGQVEIANLLLAAGAPFTICTTAMLGQTDRVAEFLKTDPAQAHAKGAHGISVLYHAVIRGNRDIAEMLLAHGAAVNAGAGGSPALHGAVLFRQPEMVDWLLMRGADPNILNYEKKTPLRVALDGGMDEIAERLRQHGGRDRP
ncbi:MAG: ankyrin repeat domain-containing protein, partial [Anaerolineales bacterium]